MLKILQLLKANLIELTRNRAAIFWTVAFPIMFIVIFGLIFSGDSISPLKVGLVNYDQSPASAPVLEALGQVPVYEIQTGDETELRDKLQKGNLSALIVIPADFGTALQSGQTSLTIVYDPGNQTVSNIATSAFKGVVDGINQVMTGSTPPIAIEEASIQATKNRQVDWLVPGILGMSIMQLGLFSSAALVTLREKKILRRFAVTPLNRSQLVVSQVLFRIVFGLVQATVLLVTGFLLFQVRIQGNLILLYAVILLALMMFLAMGYIIAALAKNEDVVEPLVQVFSMPMMFFSGVFFPIEIMPEFMQPLVRMLPLSYVNSALREIINQGHGLMAIGSDLLVMLVWLVVSLLVAIRLFRWE